MQNWCFWTVVLEKTLESPLDSNDIIPVYPKGNQSWIFTGRTDAEAELQHFGHLMWRTDSLERHWCWERLKAGGEGEMAGWHHWLGKVEGRRRWDGWMASLALWTWVWARSRSWWWIGKPGVLQFMGLQRVRHHWVTELMICKW